MKSAVRHPLFWLAVLLSLLGIGAFILLFAPIFNIYWLILAPIILTLYQLPAIYVFNLWKKRTGGKKNAPDGI